MSTKTVTATSLSAAVGHIIAKLAAHRAAVKEHNQRRSEKITKNDKRIDHARETHDTRELEVALDTKAALNEKNHSDVVHARELTDQRHVLDRELQEAVSQYRPHVVMLRQAVRNARLEARALEYQVGCEGSLAFARAKVELIDANIPESKYGTALRLLAAANEQRHDDLELEFIRLSALEASAIDELKALPASGAALVSPQPSAGRRGRVVVPGTAPVASLAES